MTEPIDGTPPGPDSPADPSAPEQRSSLEPGAALGEGPAPTQVPPAPDAPPAGWVQPPPEGGRSRGCCLLIAIAAGAIAIIPLVAIVALIFLGSQVSTILSTVGTQALAGTVQFESGTSSGCFVQQPATTFAASESIHMAAHFGRTVSAGEPVTVVVTYPNDTSESSDTTYEEAGDCLTDTIPPGLETGRYTLEFRLGSGEVATGSFEITP